MKDSDLGWSEIKVEDKHVALPLDTVSWTYILAVVRTVKLPVIGGT